MTQLLSPAASVALGFDGNAGSAGEDVAIRAPTQRAAHEASPVPAAQDGRAAADQAWHVDAHQRAALNHALRAPDAPQGGAAGATDEHGPPPATMWGDAHPALPADDLTQATAQLAWPAHPAEDEYLFGAPAEDAQMQGSVQHQALPATAGVTGNVAHTVGDDAHMPTAAQHQAMPAADAPASAPAPAAVAAPQLDEEVHHMQAAAEALHPPQGEFAAEDDAGAAGVALEHVQAAQREQEVFWQLRSALPKRNARLNVRRNNLTQHSEGQKLPSLQPLYSSLPESLRTGMTPAADLVSQLEVRSVTDFAVCCRCSVHDNMLLIAHWSSRNGCKSASKQRLRPCLPVPFVCRR